MTTKQNRFLLTLFMVVMAYEWLVSGLDKILSGTFISDFHKQMLDSLSGMQYGFYANMLRSLCLPHCVLFASLVEVGEIVVGVAFAILAVAAYRMEGAHKFLVLGWLTGFVGAFMTLNFYFYQGGSYFINPSDPFDEGIPIDLIMVLLQAGIGVYFFRLSHRDKQVHVTRDTMPHRAALHQ